MARQAWKLFRRRGVGWNVKQSTFNYLSASGDTIPISYISPYDMFEYIMTNHPGVLIGGFQSETERAHHLQAFWEGFRLQNSFHSVFSEHNGSLQCVVPMVWHGDEGRGKRRGNTAVVSIGSVIGTQSVVNSRKRARPSCDCDPSPALQRKFGGTRNRLTAEHRRLLGVQATTMKGHSFLHRYPLFIIPSSIHHEHPDAMQQLLQLIARDLKRLFFEGVTIQGKTFNAAIIGAKGDLKWFAKIALQRSWEHQGRVRNLPCCHECLGGSAGVPWDDMVSDRPTWAGTRWTQRPWTDQPCMSAVPFCISSPERQYRRDIFHLTKVGIFRDVVGSIVCFLTMKRYFGLAGSFDERLSNAHSAFSLYCKTVKRNPALRTFSRRLFTYPRFDAYPWANTKGSDTMLLLDWLRVQLTGCINDPQDPSHVPTLQIMKAVCEAARKVFVILNGHTLWMTRGCTTNLFEHLHGFIRGYVALAGQLLNTEFNGFAIKPKLHLARHGSLELDELLSSGDEVALNMNCYNCEMDEDLIGRVCRLSRRLDSRCIGQRVLSCCMLKSSILYGRFKKLHKI